MDLLVSAQYSQWPTLKEETLQMLKAIPCKFQNYMTSYLFIVYINNSNFYYNILL